MANSAQTESRVAMAAAEVDTMASKLAVALDEAEELQHQCEGATDDVGVLMVLLPILHLTRARATMCACRPQMTSWRAAQLQQRRERKRRTLWLRWPQRSRARRKPACWAH